MPEQFCNKCNKPLRPGAKFCPHCGAKTGEKQKRTPNGILSFDDFFSEEELQVPDLEEKTEKTAEEKEPDVTIPKAEPASAPTPKSGFIFREKEKDKKGKVKILDDTLELPIEEIQREIERRREKERMDARSEEEKLAGKKEMAGLFEKLKENRKDDVLIPEEDILSDEDKREKVSWFGKAKHFLFGTDASDIEGVDVKEVEASEERKVRRAKEGQKTKKEPTWDHVVVRKEEEVVTDVTEKPEIPADSASTPMEDETGDVRVEKVESSLAEDTLPGEVSEEPEEEKLSWFEKIFGVKQDDAIDPKHTAEPVVAGHVVTDSPLFEDQETTEGIKPKKNRWTVVGVAVAILLVAAIGLFFTGNYMTDPLRLYENFSEAVEADDIDRMAGMLHADGTSVNAQTLVPFQKLLKDVEYRDDLLAKLAAFDEELGKTPDADVWIEEAGSKYFLFKAYAMKIKTFGIIPEVTYPNTMVAVDGGEPISVSPDQSQVFKSHLPGPHTITGTYSGGLTPLTKSTDITLTMNNEKMENGSFTVDLKNVGKFATFTSPQEEAKVLINGNEKGKVKDLVAGGLKLGPFDKPVSVQLRLDTPFGTVLSETKEAKEDGQALEFTFPNMVEISDYHDEATIYINGENKGVLGKDLIPFHRMIGPVKPEDTIQLEMIQEDRLTKSNILTVGENEKLLFSYSKEFTIPWQYADSLVILDGVSTGKTAYELAGDDMIVDILNSYSEIQITKKFPWGTFESDVLKLDEPKTLNFTINSMNDTLVRQLQSAVVKHLEEDAFAVSNLKPNNYSNAVDPLLSERRAYIQGLIDDNSRIVRVGDKAHFDMNSIQFDDENGEYYARITESYVYFYQEYQGGIFRPIRLEMQEAREIYQHAMKYDPDQGEWVIYENRPKDSIGDNIESFDLAY